MKKPPSNRSAFINEGDELNYIVDNISYWWRIRHDRTRALAFCERLKQLLAPISKEDESIACQEYFALLHEVKGDLASAIFHMRMQITSTKKAIAWGDDLGDGMVLPSNWPKELVGQRHFFPCNDGTLALKTV